MTQRYDLLSAAGKRIARIPRFGRLLATMPVDELRSIDTPAATYLALYTYVNSKHDPDQTGLVDSGLNTEGAELLGWTGAPTDPIPNRSNADTRKWQCELAMAMLGAIAFEMYCHNQKLGRPPTHPIDQELEKFKQAACLRCSKAGAYVDDLGSAIDPRNLMRNDFKRLEQMNAHGLEYAILSSSGTDVVLSENSKRRLFFSDVSTQAFFAAYWAVKWSGEEEDMKAVSHWIPDPITEQNKEYLEFWEMVLEMPEKVVDKQRFQNLFSVHFDCRLQPHPNRPIRSTELIYRAWDRMTGSAALVAYQGEFARMVADGQPTAKGLLKDEEGTSAFIQLADPNNPRDEWDNGELRAESGSTKLSPYRLHRCCVTNAEYELFDPAHKAHRKFGDQVDVTRHPVVNVSWYDAWCFCRWLGELEVESADSRLRYVVTLPSEAQWEYGCRCGSDEPFTWHNRQNGDRIESGYCNFDGNYPWSVDEGTQRSTSNGLYLKRTIPVNGRDAELVVNRNPWGLYQMHGNVSEWCQDLYDEGLNRVLRGGSGFYNGESCRSGIRSRSDPAYRYGDCGFRLAAVLVSQAGQSSERR